MNEQTHREIHYSRFLSILILLSGACCLNESTDLLTSVDADRNRSCQSSQCHGTSPLAMAIPTSGRHSLHLAGNEIEDSPGVCSNCHWNYYDNPQHRNGFIEGFDAASGHKLPGSIVHFGGTQAGYARSSISGIFDPADKKCETISCHGGGAATWYEPVEECRGCHSPGSPRDPALTGGSGSAGKHLRHLEKGLRCTKCHLRYRETATHYNTIDDVDDASVLLTRFDSTNPSGVWSDDVGAHTGECENIECHGGLTLQWYGPNTWDLPACNECHGDGATPLTTRRQAMGVGGDFERYSHHVIDYANRTTEIVTEDDCRVCHSMDHHMNGEIIVRHADSGSPIVINSLSDLEPFCLSCHDGDGARAQSNPLRPFENTPPAQALGTIPNVAGMKIAERWNKAGGHRRQGLTCLGSGIPGSGCHGNYDWMFDTSLPNGHGSGNVGLLAKKLIMPLPDYTWDESRYQLCIDCHQSADTGVKTMTQLLGVAEGGNYAQDSPQLPGVYQVEFMESGFHDYLGYNYDRQWNLHTYHLNESMANWYYRGESGPPTTLTSCVTCHDVHGSNSQFYLWDEWGFSIVTEGNTEYGDFSGDFPVYSNALQYPQFCSVTCHWQNSGYRYPRSPFNEVVATAYNTSGGPGLENGDTVVFTFSDSTNGPVIDETNIDQILSIQPTETRVPVSGEPYLYTCTYGKQWSTSGAISAVWSSTGDKRNNVLTVTLNGNTTLAPGDLIAIWDRCDELTPNIESRILDVNGNLQPVIRQRVLRFADGSCCQRDAESNYIYGDYNVRFRGEVILQGAF